MVVTHRASQLDQYEHKPSSLGACVGGAKADLYGVTCEREARERWTDEDIGRS